MSAPSSSSSAPPGAACTRVERDPRRPAGGLRGAGARRPAPPEDGRRRCSPSCWTAHGPLPVREADDKAPLVPGRVLVAPAGYHVLVERGPRRAVDRRARALQPAVDRRRASSRGATRYGAALVGVVLTGANDDGAAGLAAVRRRGGIAIVQDPRRPSSPTMPAAALARGATRRSVAPLEEIAPLLVRSRPGGASAMTRPTAPARPAGRRPAGEPARARGGARAAAAADWSRSPPARRRSRRCCSDEFAVVLLDVQMPGMDGFETAELIKGRERTRTVPIIFVTAISKERHHVFRGYEAGAVDYLFKPYDPELLRSKVAVFLELDAKSRAAARSEALLRAAFDYAPIGMARLDLEGRVAEVNRALGEPARRAAGRAARPRCSTRSLHTDDDAATPARAALRGGGEPALRGRAAADRADGEAIPCLLTFSVAQPGGGLPARDRAGPGPARARRAERRARAAHPRAGRPRRGRAALGDRCGRCRRSATRRWARRASTTSSATCSTASRRARRRHRGGRARRGRRRAASSTRSSPATGVPSTAGTAS